MKTVRVGFHGFWPGFRPEHFVARHPYLAQRWDVVPSDRPDVVFYSYFPDPVPPPAGDHLSVYYTGECDYPDLDAHDFTISFARIADPRHLRLPNWIGRLHANGLDPAALIRTTAPPPRAEGFCSFVNGAHVGYREEFAALLGRVGRVDSPNRNLPAIGPTLADKLEFLAGYRFTIACERELVRGYVTEKLVEGALARTIPIYLGAADVGLDFDTSSFVNRHDFADDASFLEYVAELDRDPALYERVRARPFLPGNVVPRFARDETALAFFAQIFDGAPASAAVAPRPVVVLAPPPARAAHVAPVPASAVDTPRRVVLAPPPAPAAPAAPMPPLDVEGFLDLQECELLFELAREVQTGCIVEIGSYRGRSTVALALGTRAGNAVPVYAIEPHESFVGEYGGVFGPADRRAFFENALRTETTSEIRLVNLPSETVAPGWTHEVGLLWIDGDHAEDAVRRDFSLWRPHVARGGLVAFHDSTKPGLGPATIVEEALASGEYAVRTRRVSTTVLERVAA